MSQSRGRTTARRLMNSILTSPWLIREDWLQEFAGLAEEARARGADLTADELREKLRAVLAGVGREGATPGAISVDYGQPLEGGYAATVRDGVAIIPVMGPLYHYANVCTEACGATAYATLAKDISAALNSPDVSAILYEVDSPGGEVAGCAELSQMIYDARGVKPSASFVSDLGCSASYYVGSSAGEVVIASTAVVGSIGVVMSFADTSERDAKSGVRRFEILSSQSPNKRADPNTDRGRAQIQEMLDDLAGVFVADVARNRGVSVDTVLSDFGQGGVMVGARAVTAGLADRLGSFEGVLAELAQRGPVSRRGVPAGGGIRSTHSEEPLMATETKTAPPAAETEPAQTTTAALTAESVERDHPAVAAALRSAGAEAERARITGILALVAAEGDRAIALECVESGATKGEAAEKILAARNDAAQKSASRGATYLAGAKAAEEEIEKPAPSADQADAHSDDAVASRLLSAAGQKPAAH